MIAPSAGASSGGGGGQFVAPRRQSGVDGRHRLVDGGAGRLLLVDRLEGAELLLEARELALLPRVARGHGGDGIAEGGSGNEILEATQEAAADAGILASVAAFSGLLFLIDPGKYPGPLFSVFSGGLLLGAYCGYQGLLYFDAVPNATA